MKKGYHPYIPNTPSTPSKRALELDQVEYDSSDEEAVNKVYLGKKVDWKSKYEKEKRKRKVLSAFVKELMNSQ
jgi:hypothetical protein